MKNCKCCIESMLGMAAVGAFYWALLGNSALSQGQVQRIYDGHALDANPRIGSGGYNAPEVPGYVPVNGNEIVTGNVTGLNYFHGNVPYRDFSVFAGSLPSAQIGRFLRVAAPPPAQGAFSQNFAPYYLPSSLTAGYDTHGNLIAPTAGGGLNNPVVPAYAIAPSSPLAYSPVATVYGAYAQANGPQGQMVTLPPVWNSNPFNTQISALYGARGLYANQQPGHALDVPSTLPAQEANNPANQFNPQQPASTQEGPRTDNIVNPISGARENPPLDAQIHVGTVGGGQQQALVGRTDIPQKALPSDPYQALLNDLNTQAYKHEKEQQAAANNAPAAPGPNGENPKNVKTQDIDPLTGLPRFKLVFPPAQTQPSASQETGTAAQPDIRAGHDLPALKSLAGAQPTAFNEAMASAEKALQKGQYTRAMDYYDNAIALEPGNSLTIIGRGHAELGAGLYGTAAYDLEFVFQRKPQFMAVHYDLKQFLAPERVAFLKDDLKRIVEKTPQNSSAWFLLAYLQYQAGDAPVMNATLDGWKKSQPKSNWPEMLGKAWN